MQRAKPHSPTLISMVAAGFLGGFVAPTQTAARTIELVLDASGSMNARMPDGQTRIATARSVLAQVVSQLPAGTQLAFRAYGHQSPRERHDCNDTQLLVPFGDATALRTEVTAAAGRLRAQGYTPITRVLEIAAKDLAASPPGERAIILVSDGKETCEGDPCATARALKQANAELVVHTIGFAVDAAARAQLQCIASASGGTYSDADSAPQLLQALGQATVAPMAAVVQPRQEPGNLTVQGADLSGHKVFDAVTGQQVGEISSLKSTIRVKAGIYHVSFGQSLWKSVVVEPDKVTVLQPGILEVKRAGLSGHEIRDSETGALLGEVSSIKSSITLLPGVYDVTFGEVAWPLIKVDSGKKTVLDAGGLRLQGASFAGHRIATQDGKVVGSLSSLVSFMPLPPGDYTVEIAGRRVPFTVKEGQVVELAAK